jgi:hypothetical protein
LPERGLFLDKPYKAGMIYVDFARPAAATGGRQVEAANLANVRTDAGSSRG